MTEKLSKDELEDLLSARVDYLDFLTTDSDEIKIFHIPVEKMRTGHWADPQLPLLYSFGMPQDTELALRNMAGARFGDQYKKFTVELFGVVGEMPPDIRLQTDTNANRFQIKNWRSHVMDLSQIPKDEIRAGAYLGIPLEGGGIVAMQVWRTRIFMDGSSMYAEELWHGRRRVWFRRIENIPFMGDHSATATQVKRLADALSLPSFFVRQKTRGDELSEQDFQTLGLTTIEKLARKSSKLSERAFAKEIGYNRQTIQKYRTKYPQVWPRCLRSFKNSKASG
jgi:hypothetical protein